jgi:hypothetical protein
MAGHPRVVSVFPNRGHRLHTTRSWEFLGMEEEGGRVRPGSLWAKARFGEGVVIGNLDTGTRSRSCFLNMLIHLFRAWPIYGYVSLTESWGLTSRAK